MATRGPSVFATALLGFAIAVSGCSLPCHTPGRAVADRAGDWQAGVELVSYYSWKAHSGQAGDRAFHNATHPISPPASCEAYRGDQRFSKDTCQVRPGPDNEWEIRPQASWTLLAEWAGGDCDADRERGDSVVAFDGAGRPVAWWAGRFDEGASIMTE